MSRPDDDPPPASQVTGALRAEIRQAGDEVAWGRRFLARGFWGLAALMALGVMSDLLAVHFVDEAIIASTAIFIASAIGAPALFRVSERQRHRMLLGYRLRRLEPEKRIEVLLPLLQESPDDAQAIAAQLAEELGIRTELVPAAAPDGRGAEASSAEEAR